MTEKRFIVDEYYEIGSIIIDTHNENIKFKHENKLSMQQCCDLLNELYEENEQLKSDAKYWSKTAEIRKKKIEQLQTRNDKQAKRLGNLYSLIEQKDWKSLYAIIEDFKRCDEQLAREECTYVR